MLNRSLKPDIEAEKWALPRRDFLVLSSAAVFGAAASSVSAAALRVVAAPGAGAILSVGFTGRTAPAAAEANEAASSVIPAKTLRVTDNNFRQSGVRVMVHGLSSPENRVSDSVSLSTFAPAAAGPVPFLAWTHSVRGGQTARSPRASFLAALDENGTLPIAVERSSSATRWSRLFAPAALEDSMLPDLAALEQSGNVCRLSSGDRGDVRLRPGTYFIALRQSSSDRQPDWTSIDVDWTTADASGVLRHHGRPVGFEYLTVTVDYPAA